MFTGLRSRHLAGRILSAAAKLKTIGDIDLRKRATALGWRARSGESLAALLPTAFPLAIEACRRELGLTHFPVQIMGGLAIFGGAIAEMQTGEGKTLTAVLPAALRALVGKGCHVLTANDYLAQRDAELLRPVYARLGLTCGCVHEKLEDDERRENYACDITYGTATQIGFDFLHDRLKLGPGSRQTERPSFFDAERGERPVQRGFHFALVDEADSILIDEARTPLIIGLQQPDRPAALSLYQWAARVVPRLRGGDDFIYHPGRRQAELTDDGCRRLNLQAKPVLMDSLDNERIYDQVEKALTAHHGYQRDREYVIAEGKVAIVDEGTGRVMDGRQWQEGLHQAVEAKERVEVTPITASAARISIQTLFRQYPYLAGMSGTALPARRELSRAFKLRVRRIPTNRPCLRQGLSPRVFSTQAAKRTAVAAEVRRLQEQSRAILIGTPSVDASEALSRELTAAGIEHAVLNATHHASEAAIVAKAGRTGAVTIATNMAGRGTDIHLEDAARAAGGLHVIATEMHSSARIDRQLVGRSARQGDPGGFQFLLSLEDELLHVMEPRQLLAMRSRARPDERGELGANWLKLFQTVQRRCEVTQARQRTDMLRHERERMKRTRQAGLDAFLETADA